MKRLILCIQTFISIHSSHAADNEFKEKSVRSLLRRIRDTDGKRNAQKFIEALERKIPETDW